MIISIIAVAIIVGISSTVLVQNNNNTDETSMVIEDTKILRRSFGYHYNKRDNRSSRKYWRRACTCFGLMGPGVDPHLYRPSANDVKKLQDANIVFYNGLDLEGKMGDIFVKIGREGTAVWAVSENIPSESLLSLDTAGHFDPHIWWSAELWIEASKIVATGLSEYDPENSEIYEKNLEEYKTITRTS